MAAPTRDHSSNPPSTLLTWTMPAARSTLAATALRAPL
jgi:hypothetical protein